METYIHYGSNKFDKEKFKPIKNRAYFAKPYGGLWASRVNDPEGWKTWCEDNDFCTDELATSFKFTLKDGAKVHIIERPKDIYKLPGQKPEKIRGFYMPDFYPDFEECIRQGIDAIEVVNICGVDSEGEQSVYMALYTWDVNSILILNPDIVKEVIE